MTVTRELSEKHAAIHTTVAAIPPGQVSTYGDVARAAGLPGHARLVGYTLHALPEGSELPWHRVVNAQGRISLPPDSRAAELQRERLESEGVGFGLHGRIDLAIHGWRF